MPARTNWMGGEMGSAVKGKCLLNTPIQKDVDITVDKNVYVISKNNKVLLTFTSKSKVLKSICSKVIKCEENKNNGIKNEESKSCQRCPNAATQVAQTTAV